MRPWIALCIALLLFSTAVSAQQVITGKVVRVIDGDTFDLLSPDHIVRRIRLLDIDAPERGQDYYRVSRQALADKIYFREVRVKWSKTDRYQRILGVVWCDGVYINRYLVEAGYAWHFVRYSTDRAFAQAEQRARAGRRGLWASAGPMPPWDFRKRRK